jgi:hypothetical protein
MWVQRKWFRNRFAVSAPVPSFATSSLLSNCGCECVLCVLVRRHGSERLRHRVKIRFDGFNSMETTCLHRTAPGHSLFDRTNHGMHLEVSWNHAWVCSQLSSHAILKQHHKLKMSIKPLVYSKTRHTITSIESGSVHNPRRARNVLYISIQVMTD